MQKCHPYLPPEIMIWINLILLYLKILLYNAGQSFSGRLIFEKKKSFSLINSCVNICPSPCGLTLLWVHDFNKLKSTIPEVDSTYLFVKWFLRIRFFNFSKNFTTNPNHLPKKTMYPFYFNKRVSPLPLPKSALVKIRPMVLEKKLKM